MRLSEIKPNPNNPRVIKDAAFEKLCNSIKEFPKMMALRPIVVDGNNMVLGGNMRLKALQHLGFRHNNGSSPPTKPKVLRNGT